MKAILLVTFVSVIFSSIGWAEWKPSQITPIAPADGKTSLDGVRIMLRRSPGVRSVQGKLTVTKNFSLCNIERTIDGSTQFSFSLAGEQSNGGIVYEFLLGENLVSSSVITICDPKTDQLFEIHLAMFGVYPQADPPQLPKEKEPRPSPRESRKAKAMNLQPAKSKPAPAPGVSHHPPRPDLCQPKRPAGAPNLPGQNVQAALTPYPNFDLWSNVQGDTPVVEREPCHLKNAGYKGTLLLSAYKGTLPLSCPLSCSLRIPWKIIHTN